MVGQWIKRKIVLAALVLFGLGSQPCDAQAASVSGTLVDKAIVVAVNANNETIQAVETQPTGQVSPVIWGFTLQDLPASSDVSVYVFMDGKFFPMIFSNGTKDAFQLIGSTSAFNLGLVSIDWLNYVAHPATAPISGNALASTSDKRSTINFTSIQNTALNPFPNMDVPTLIQYGNALFSHGWFVVADKFYAQAEQLASTNASPLLNQARVLHSVSQVFAVLNTARSVANTATTDYGNGTATLGDLLAGFGCDRRHLGLSLMRCPNPLPGTAPTGGEIKGWLNAHVIPKVSDAIIRISQVPNTLTAFTFRDPGDPWDAGTTIDHADVLAIKGILEAGLSQLHWLQAYEWGVDVDDSQHKTIEQVKTANPNLSTLAANATSILAVSKNHALSAVDDLLTAMTAIQSRSGSQTSNLFTLNASEITSATSRLNEVKSSLSASTGIKDESGNVGMHLNLSKIFDGISLRAMLPPFLGDAFAGLFPDPTMGGVLPDNKYNFAGESLNQDVNGDGIPDVLQSELKNYVPTATMTVDGAATDWADINPVLTDPSNDVIDYLNVVPLADTTPYGAADFRRLFIAQDSSKVYLRIERASDVIPSGFTATYTVMFTAIDTPVYDVTYIYLSGNSLNCYHNSQTLTPASYAISGQTVEISCPLSVFMNLTGRYRVDVYSSVWKSGGGQYFEYNDMARIGSLTFGPKPALASGGTSTPLWVSSTTLTQTVGQSSAVTVSGGTTPYSFMIDPPSAGVISLSDTTATGTTITCLKAGTSTLRIPDSGAGAQAQSGTVAVTCNAAAVSFAVDPTSLNLNVGAKSTLVFSGGSGSYSIQVDNSGVISLGEITGTSAEIYCMKAGSSTVGVLDTASHTASVPVTCNAVPPTTVSYDPVNLTVGSGMRSLSFPTGTTVTVLTGTDVISGSATGVSCLKAGTATVSIVNASANTEGSATVRCVAPVAEITTTDTARWVFPTPDITMVMQARWMANGSSVVENFLDYSRTGGTTTLKDRNVSIQSTSWGEIYYTHDANGLTIHGEKENTLGTNASTRYIHYGLITAPNLASAGVVSADLADSNRTTPPARMPHDLASGVVSPQYVVRYALDEQGNIMPSSWTVIKTEITVTPNVNLLASVPPTERANDTYFAHWRDTITHPDLLNKISRVAHVQMVESRYTAMGVTTPSSQFTSHLYQAQDLGTVYEVTAANNGVWKGGLTAMTSLTGELKSLSAQRVKTRKVRIDAPVGTVLNSAFVWTRGDHTSGAFASNPHGHNAVSLINETPGTNSALFTLFNRLDPPADDQVEVLNVTYGAMGFMPKTVPVQTSAITDPQVLTLTQADQPGQPLVASGSPVQTTSFFQFSEVPPTMSMATVTLSPVNLSVDDTRYRVLNLPTTFGTPVIEVTSVSTPDMILGDPINGVKCLKEGTAQVKITFGTQAQGSTTVNCVAPAPADTLVRLPEWLFPENTTLVTNTRWQPNGTPVRYDASLQASRALGAGTWHGRDVKVMRNEEGEEYYTLDETHGLAFHGEKRFDRDRNTMESAVNFSLINPPNLTTGITEADLAEANRTAPVTLVPGLLTSERSNTVYTARFEVDATGTLKRDKWSVTKTDIHVNGNVNLLSPVPPSEFFSTPSDPSTVDGYFTGWRDSVTDPELLKKLTHALHVKVIETRYEAFGTQGVANAVSQTNDIYLVQGLGVVYERNKENDGVWKGALWAFTDPNGDLHALTLTGVTTRSVEIVGPEGSTLTGAYVSMHAPHLDPALYNTIHTHNNTGWFKEASGNRVKFITFNRLNAPDNDKVTQWNVSYGAEGFVRKEVQVDAASTYSFALTDADRVNPTPAPLTATLSSQNLTVGVQGQIVVSGGTPTYRYETSAGFLSVSEYTATGAKLSCSGAGSGTVTVFDAANQSLVVEVLCTAQSGGGTSPPLTLEPINLTVGSEARAVNVPSGAVPGITAGADVIELAETGVICKKAGTATVHVTVGTDQATTTVTCLNPPANPDTAISIVDWLFPAETTLVTHGLWQPKSTTSGGTLEYSMQASVAHGTAMLKDRAVSVERNGDGESYYTLNEHGLTFHGEKRVDFWQNRTSRTIHFGFVTDPDIATGISAATLAQENLTAPKPFVPATVTQAGTHTHFGVSFQMDANDQILPDKWTVTKTEITLTPNVNLLAAVPPVEALRDNGYFAHWRDSITDAELLQKVMHALHVKMVETRYHPGQTNPESQTNHVFLGQGVGQLFEHNQEGDGLWSGALRAIVDASGVLKSLTTDQVAIRQVDIVGPEGVELKGAYVQARAEHMDTVKYNPPHTHQLTGWFTSKPNGHTARFALFTRVNPPESDKVETWQMNYGAEGYVRKHESVPTATMGNPHTLALTTSDQGIAKPFRVTFADGTPVQDAGLQILRHDGTQCVSGPGEGSHYDLGDEGVVTVPLTPGTHCVGVWPNNGSGSFMGGWYDSAAVVGTVNVKEQLTNSASFTVSVTSGELVLVVGSGGGTPTMVTLSGTITDGTNGLGNVQIRASSTSGGTEYTFVTSPSGAFSMTLPVGTYSFKFSYEGGSYSAEAYLQSVSETGIQLSAEDDHAMPIPVQQSLTLPVIKLTSEYQSGGGGGDTGGTKITVSGTVTNSKGGLSGIQVEFQPDWNNNTGYLEWVTVKSGENGAYTASIKPGKYRVQFRSEYWDNTQQKMVKIPGVLGWGGYASGDGKTSEIWDQAEVFDFTQATTLNALMPSGVLVSGVVKNAENQPVRNVKVELQPDWESASDVAEWRDAITDQDGKYSIFVKKGSVYRVFFNTNYWNWETQTQVKLPGLGGYSTGSTENITVNGNMDAAKKYRIDTDTVVDAQLLASLSIKGKVTSGGTTPLNNIPVRFQPELDPETNSYGIWGEVRTNALGEYEFSAQPGRYRIEVPSSTWRWDLTPPVEEKLPNGLVGGFADGEGHVTQEWSSAKVFEVKSSVMVNMDLVTGMTLSGKVVRSDGTPVKGASVSVHTHDWNINFSKSTGEDGFFSVTVIPGKEYKVDVWPAYCEGAATSNPECSNAVKFQGGSWITPPKASWVSRWVESEHESQPLVKASTIDATQVFSHNDISGQEPGVIPGMVMSQWDEHLVTNILMDKSLVIGIRVDAGKPIQGRVVDGQDNPVPYAWVNTPFGGMSTDQGGYFTMNLPSVNLEQGVDNTFDISIYPGGHVDQQGMWVPGSGFMGGVVTGSMESGFSLSSDWQQAVRFEKDLNRDAEGEVAWPQTDIGHDLKGLLVKVSKGIEIKGTVTGNGQPLANIWVNAWSHEAHQGGGQSTDSSGHYVMLVPNPAPGQTVWYEVNLWNEQYLPPEPVLVRVQAAGVTGVFERAKDKYIEDEDGFYRPAPGQAIGEEKPDGTAIVDFNLTSGNTISGRVTDAQNNGMSWTWVDVHTKDGGKWYGANTDENGNYRVTVAPANDYIAVVWGWSGQYRTTYYKNVGKEDAATLIDVSNGNREGVDIQMNSGAKISGTIKGLTSGVKLWLNVWSESEGSWGGKEVVGTGQDVSYEVTGLAPAKDYRLDWRSESDEVPAGYYGGVVGGEVSGPKSWEKATLISTLNGNVVGVGIDLTRIQTKTLHVKVDGIPAGTKAVDVNLWSEKLESGRWKQTKVNAGQTEVSVDVKGLESSDDYRLFIGGPDALFKVGNFKGEVSGSGYPATGGSVVGWDRATLIDMSAERYVHVSLGSGRKLTVVVSGLPNGEKAWVDAFSESTWSWGGAELISTSDTASGQVEIKGLEEAGDYRISIWGAKIRGGSYAGENAEPDTWDKAKLVSVSGQDATVNMRVSSGRSIAGQVSGLQKGQWGWVDAWSSGSYSWSGNSVQAGGTGTDGYTLGGLGQASDFRVSFLSEGYVPRYVEGVDTTNGNVSGVNFAASTGGSISGSIRGLKAYEWARVDAWSPATGAFVVGGATADGSGAATYRLTGLPDGSDYVIGLWRGMQGLFYTTNGVTVSWDRHSPVTVSSGGAVSGIDFDLSNAANLFFTLSGAVSGVGETQVVEINAWSSTGGGRTSVTGNGTYKLEGLSAGTYTVEVMSPGYVTKRTRSVTVASGAVTEAAWTYGWNDVNGVSLQGNTTGLNVAMESGRAITGTVKVGSTSVSGAWVNAWSEGLATGGGAVTDAAGKYAIKGLPAGTYRVDVWTTEGTVGDTVTVGADADQVKDLSVVKSAGIIRGKVTSDGTTASVKALVLAYDASGVERDRAVSDSGGDYRLEGLEPNQSYTLKVFAATNGNWSTTGSGYATSCAVTAISGDGTTQNLTLGTAPQCVP
ncbi:hypothetical protein SIID45300_00835 [Candidatus Magnetaquicoccaceae bacterium FCR-1]|uniref:Uncharacterized protein n=1 Tax=Candidatus Magnetaquiglobus chichijimensis TaxID=3141448 RepID=A0ABQ0C6L4_9PROT